MTFSRKWNGPGFNAITSVIAVGLLAGCTGLTEPHIIMDRTANSSEDACKGKTSSSVTIDDAINCSLVLQEKMERAAANHAEFNAWMGTALIPAGTAALALGVTGASSTSVLALGAASAAGVGVGQWLTGKESIATYLGGAEAIGCAISFTQPLNFSNEETGELIADIAILSDGSLDEAIRDVEVEIGKAPSSATSEVAAAQASVADAKILRSQARQTAEQGQSLVDRNAVAGLRLITITKDITIRVNKQISENRPDLASLANTLSGAIPDQIKGIAGLKVPKEEKKPEEPQLTANTEATPIQLSPLETARQNLETITSQYRGAVARISSHVNRVAVAVPEGRLEACAVKVDPAKKPLTLEPNTDVTMTAGEALTHPIKISGGTPDYADPEWLNDPGKDSGLTAAKIENGGVVFAMIQAPKGNKVKAGTYVLRVKDKDGNERSIKVIVKTK